MKIIHYDSMYSTQRYSLDNLDKLENMTCVYCENQQMGYGRSGSWDTYKGDLTCSYILENKNEINILYAIVGAIVNLVLHKIGINSHIKIPNDIYVIDKKIGGIIIDIVDNKMIIGIGINIKPRKNMFIDRTSCNEENIYVTNREIIELLNLEFEKIHIEKKLYLDKWKEDTKLLNKKIMFEDNNNKISGIVTEYDYRYIEVDNIKYDIFKVSNIRL